MTRETGSPREPLKHVSGQRSDRLLARWFARFAPPTETAAAPALAGAAARLHAFAAAVIRLFAHPALLVVGLSICVAFLMRALFFEASVWLWHFALPVSRADVAPWVRWAMEDRDGAEPYGLVAVVVAQWLLTGAALAVLLRLPNWCRAIFGVGLVYEALLLELELPPLPPLSKVHASEAWAGRFALGCLAATWLLTRIMRRREGIPTVLAVLLVPLCFVPIAYTNLSDLTCILLPSLRIEQGTPWSHIYFQYDLLPSLLGLGWIKAGGAPAAFCVLVAGSYYALFLGLFLFARRLFRRAELAAPLLISGLLVRFYSFDGFAAPQTTPMRLDLWLIPLVLVHGFGLGHWSLGLILGGLCFFSRSMSPLIVGAYGLTVLVEFLTTYGTRPRSQRARLPQALLQLARHTAPVWGGVLIGLLASRWVFGSFNSDALELYRKYQVGMMRIAPSSFYWWLLALTGGAGVWVAWKRVTLTERQGQTALFALALLLASSLYFFGRSHENNLINISLPFLLCLFLVLDLAWPTAADGVPVLGFAFRAAPWLVVATCAYFYSGRAGERLVHGQFREIMTMSPWVQQSSPQSLPPIDCAEIAQAAPERRVLFFTKDDYWYYQACQYAAPGYIQPLHLVVFKAPLVADMSAWLRAGYKIFVPRRDDWMGPAFGEFRPQLPMLQATLTQHFTVYSLRR